MGTRQTESVSLPPFRQLASKFTEPGEGGAAIRSTIKFCGEGLTIVQHGLEDMHYTVHDNTATRSTRRSLGPTARGRRTGGDPPAIRTVESLMREDQVIRHYHPPLYAYRFSLNGIFAAPHPHGPKDYPNATRVWAWGMGECAIP